MAALLNKGIIIRKFRYMKYRFNVDEFYKDRMSILPIPPVHPSQIREGRHFVRLGGIISEPINNQHMIKSRSFDFLLGTLKGIFRRTSPPTGKDGNGDQDKSFEMTKREEEVKKWQETREREIQHKFELESLWKAMKERNTLLRGNKNDKDHDNDKPDK